MWWIGGLLYVHVPQEILQKKVIINLCGYDFWSIMFNLVRSIFNGSTNDLLRREEKCTELNINNSALTNSPNIQ